MGRVVISLWLVLAAVLVAGAGPAAAAPTPVVSGNRLVDTSTGKELVLRGVNWPSFEYACVEGYAYARDNRGPRAMARIAAWHANAVRLGLNQDCWLGDDGLPAGGGQTPAGYRDAVADAVDAITANGMVAILELHWSAPQGTVADGQRALPDARSAAFWTSVAARFRTSPSVLFDVFNEPYSRYDLVGGHWTTTFELTWSCWRDGGGACGAGAPLQHDKAAPFDGTRYAPAGMQAMVDAVRGAGATQPVLVSGIDYANDLRGWLGAAVADGDPGRADDQLVASFHNYNTQRCNTPACWNAEIAPVAAVVPVVTAELGETDCTRTHMNAYMDWADARGIGYLAWAWWTLDNLNCDQLALILDDDGTPREPNGTALHARLAKLHTEGEPARVTPTPAPTASPTPVPSATATPPPIASFPPPPPVIATPTPAPPAVRPKITLGRTVRKGRRRTVPGSIAPAAARRLSLVVSLRRPGSRTRTRTLRRTYRSNARGAFRIVLTLPRGWTVRKATLSLPGYPKLSATRNVR